jgi:hypothetical protein
VQLVLPKVATMQPKSSHLPSTDTMAFNDHLQRYIKKLNQSFSKISNYNVTSKQNTCKTIMLKMLGNVGKRHTQNLWYFQPLKGGLNGLPVYVHHKRQNALHQQTDYLYYYTSKERSQWMVSDAVGSGKL